MKRFKIHYIGILLLVIGLAGSSFSGSKDDGAGSFTNTNEIMGGKMKIRINSKVFTATLTDNATARAFSKLLPMTIHMKELNGNEKYFDLAASLPAQAVDPGRIKNGDIMLYGSNTLVLFYKTFSTSYNYTKVGTVDHVEGYAEALGTGNLTVEFQLIL